MAAVDADDPRLDELGRRRDDWPRLVPLLPADHTASIETAKTQVDFMLNSSALCVALAVLVLNTAVLAPLAPGDGTGAEMLATAACFALAIAFYRGSIGRAVAWGGLVKAAFDLHRKKLLSALGVEHEPATLLAERAVWREVRIQLTYLDPWDGSDPPLVFVPPSPPAPPRVRAREGIEGLRLARGVERLGTGDLRVILQIENPGTASRSEVEVVDALPTGWEYAWGTVTASGNATTLRGDRELHIAVGDLPGPGKVEVAYTMLPRPPTTKGAPP